jgi:hypothetical protein
MIKNIPTNIINQFLELWENETKDEGDRYKNLMHFSDRMKISDVQEVLSICYLTIEYHRTKGDQLE